METLVMLAARVLLLNAFGWIWHYCNSSDPGEFRITKQAWGWSFIAVLINYAAELGAFQGDGPEM